MHQKTAKLSKQQRRLTTDIVTPDNIWELESPEWLLFFFSRDPKSIAGAQPATMRKCPVGNKEWLPYSLLSNVSNAPYYLQTSLPHLLWLLFLYVYLHKDIQIQAAKFI